MSWISFDYRCPECGAVTNKIFRRGAAQEQIECECGSTANKMYTANITRVSYVDGTDRWKHVKEQRALKQMQRQAKKNRDHGEYGRLQREIAEVKEASRKEKKAETPVKVSEKE